MLGAADNFHSQLVGWSKVILPLCGIGLLSTLFLFAKSDVGTGEIPIAEIEKIAHEQRINAPRFSGVTDDGAVVAITAKSAQPNPASPDIMQIDDIRLNLDAPDGSTLRIVATKGEIDGKAGTGRLLGLARLETSSGFLMETNGLTADFRSGKITSDGALEVRAPFGALTAGRVSFQSVTDDTNRQMLFTDGVRLIYRPPNPKSEDANQ